MRIVTDSAGDFPRELARELDIVTVPIRVNVGGTSFKDGVDFPITSFAAVEAGSMLSTSQPSPWDFQGVFADLTSRGHEVLCLTLSEKLSGTYQSAIIAARQFLGKVRVIDTKLVSAPQGLLVLRVARAAAGKNLEQLAQLVETEKSRIRGFAALDSVEPIVRGGRTSIFARHAAGREGIKLIFTIDQQGGIQVLERVRGRRSSLDRLAEIIAEKNCPEVAMAYVDSITEAAMVARSIQERSQAKILYVQEAGGAVRAYAGPGAVIVAG